MTTTVGPLLASTASSSNSNNNNNNHNNNNNNNNTHNSKTANTSKTGSTTTKATKAKTQPPRTARRRPQNFRSLLLLIIIMCQLQQFFGGGGGGCGGGGLAMAAPLASVAIAIPEATPAPLSAILKSPTATATATAIGTATVAARSLNQTRLRKRHDISFQDSFRRELNSSVLDWSNGCGGNWTGPESAGHAVRSPKRCSKHKKLLRILQSKTGRELRQLRIDNKIRQPVYSMKAQDTASNQAIDISQHGIWKMHNSQYDFLPRLNASGDQLALRRAHHDLQFYIAGFSYLRHAQLHWDFVNMQKQSVLSSELLRYRSSARTVLCIVEEAINGTSRLYAPSQRHSQQHQHQQQQQQQHQHHLPLLLGQIKTVPRKVMEKRLLKFKTPLVKLHRQAVLAARNLPAAPPSQPQHLDALFLKYEYMEYLKHMTQLLAKQRKRTCKKQQRPVT